MKQLRLPFYIFVIFLSFSNFNLIIAQTNTATILRHDDGTSSGVIQVRLSPLPNSGHEDKGTYAIYRGVPDLVNFSNRLEIWQSPHSDLIIDHFRRLSADLYYVTFHDGINLHVFTRTILREGCTDPNATNYDPEAVIENGSCTYDSGSCPDIFSVVGSEPNCGGNSGVISIFSNGTSLQYSINGGQSYQSSNTFSGLETGSYSIRVRSTSLN